MKYVLGTIALLFTVFAIVSSSVLYYNVSKDTDALINRAQVAADREDMHAYLVELRGNLEDRGMTRGHTALIFRKPDNDLALNYQAINRLIERLEGIAEISKSDTAYQVALDDIRGTLRELPNPAFGYTWVANHWMLWLGLVLWLLSGIAFFMSDY